MTTTSSTANTPSSIDKPIRVLSKKQYKQVKDFLKKLEQKQEDERLLMCLV